MSFLSRGPPRGFNYKKNPMLLSSNSSRKRHNFSDFDDLRKNTLSVARQFAFIRSAAQEKI